MKTLRDAWRWYEAVSVELRLMGRLARRHWNELPWEGGLGRDDWFRTLEQEKVKDDVNLGEEPLADLAVLVLFSVFEAQVRGYVHDEVKREEGTLIHPALKLAAEETLQHIKEGSFFRVLEPFKGQHADLVEQANQVRRYRNWVAHGRRSDRPFEVDLRTAFDRLQRLLDAIGITDDESKIAGAEP